MTPKLDRAEIPDQPQSGEQALIVQIIHKAVLDLHCGNDEHEDSARRFFFDRDSSLPWFAMALDVHIDRLRAMARQSMNRR